MSAIFLLIFPKSEFPNAVTQNICSKNKKNYRLGFTKLEKGAIMITVRVGIGAKHCAILACENSISIYNEFYKEVKNGQNKH